MAKVVIELKLRSGVDAEHALEVIDRFLDDGSLQDAINECECDFCYEGTQHYLGDEGTAARVVDAIASVDEASREWEFCDECSGTLWPEDQHDSYCSHNPNNAA